MKRTTKTPRSASVNHKQRPRVALLSLMSAATLFVISCGSTGGGVGSNDTSGFDYDADQIEVDSAIDELDPVTLVYQANAVSQESVVGQAGTMVKEEIEERSGGKITVDITWGQGIAAYDELNDALVDGRIDLAFHHPIYFPNDYPVYHQLSTAMSGLPSSPYQGEIVTSAVVADVALNTPALMDEYESHGITPLLPMMSSGSYNSLCTQPGNQPEDWAGRQIRVGSQPLEKVTEDMGGSPVSMQYAEIYDGLQRNVLDCTLIPLVGAGESSFTDVAPYVSYTSQDVSFPTHAIGAHVAGSSFPELPLAYQQIIYDSIVEAFAGDRMAITEGGVDAIERVHEVGGEIEQLDSETEQIIIDSSKQLREEAISDAALGDDVVDRIDESTAKWQQVAEELGIEDGGSVADFNEWHESDVDEILEFGEQLFDDVFLSNRPE